MSEQASTTNDNWRDRVLSDPEMILQDRDLMQALIAADARKPGANVVDIRTVAMARLEARLSRLENAHRSVISTTCHNLAGTDQVHRAVLRLLECAGFETFVQALKADVPAILHIDRMCLMIEISHPLTAPPEKPARHLGQSGPCGVDGVLQRPPEGAIARYVKGTAGADAGPLFLPPVTLRLTPEGAATVFGPRARDVGSEALLTLPLGRGRPDAMLALGAHAEDKFRPGQGTDLLVFFAQAFARLLKWHLGSGA